MVVSNIQTFEDVPWCDAMLCFHTFGILCVEAEKRMIVDEAAVNEIRRSQTLFSLAKQCLKIPRCLPQFLRTLELLWVRKWVGDCSNSSMQIAKQSSMQLFW